MRLHTGAAAAALSLFLAGLPARADVQLITNGGFETGTLAGWTVTNADSGNWFANSTTSSPLSGFPTAGPASGSWYAISDQTGPGVHALVQSFTVPVGVTRVIVSYDMFVNDWDGGPICGPGLSDSSGPVECGRVDVLTAAATAFDTGAGVVTNLYQGADAPLSTSHPYTHYSFDLSGLLTAGNTYKLRFAEADNQSFFNQGVDNVSVLASSVPEPSSIVLLGSIMTALGMGLKRKRS